MKKKIVIWGAGYQGENALHFFDMNVVNIIGYVDSNPCKIESKIHGYKVMSINQLKIINFDFVFISPIDHQNEIYEKALAMGIDKEKIIFTLVTEKQMGSVFDLFTEKGIAYINFLPINNLRRKADALRNRVDNIEHMLTIERKRSVNLFLKEHYERQAAEFVAKNFIDSDNAPGRSVIFENRFDYWKYIAEKVKNKDGLFLEFGVYQGKSINYMSELLKDKIIYGFDSFEGLPEDWHPGYEKGRFNENGVMPKCNKNVC